MVMLFDEKELVESESDDEPKSKRGREMREEEEGLSKLGSTTCFDVPIASCFSCIPTYCSGVGLDLCVLLCATVPISCNSGRHLGPCLTFLIKQPGARY